MKTSSIVDGNRTMIQVSTLLSSFSPILSNAYSINPAHGIRTIGLSWQDTLPWAMAIVHLVSAIAQYLFLESTSQGEGQTHSHRVEKSLSHWLPMHLLPDPINPLIAGICPPEVCHLALADPSALVALDSWICYSKEVGLISDCLLLAGGASSPPLPSKANGKPAQNSLGSGRRLFT